MTIGKVLSLLNLLYYRLVHYLFALFLIVVNNTTHSQNWELVWSDEFDGELLNTEKWVYGIGLSNDNVHYYTDRIDNVYLADGILNITALEESYQGFNYTSGLVKTAGITFWRYGKIEARIKLPQSNGFVPAFWLLPEENIYGWWPKSGEIDIMEHPTNEINKIYGTVHTEAYNSFTGSGPVGEEIVIPDAESEFHVYSIIWNENQIDFYVDDQKYFTFNNDNLNSDTWPFNEQFHLILNLAVGGGWVGNPDENTIFPARMEVDFVRVYQDLKDIQITGPDYLLIKSRDVKYSLPDVPNATYSWTLPNGVELVSEENQDFIFTDWGDFGGTIYSELQHESNIYTLELKVNVSTNFLKNPDFEKGAKYWNQVVGYPAIADFILDSNDTYSGEKTLKIDVQNLAANPWDIQLSQSNIHLGSNKSYIINFWAKEENGNGQINAALINPENFTVYKLETFSLTPEWTQYNLTYNSNSDQEAALNIDLGAKSGIYYVDDFIMSTPDQDIPNILLNPNFSNSDNGWYLTVLWPAVAVGGVESGEYRISIENGGNNFWDIFLGQSELLIENGKEYYVSFDAYAASPRTISAFVGKNSDPWTVYSGSNIISLNTAKQTYNYSFRMNYEDDSFARLGFDLGNSAEDVYFDNIFLVEITDTVTSINNKNSVAHSFNLSQNYPNPFNPTTIIKYSIPMPTRTSPYQREGLFVSLKIFDILGREIVILINQPQKPGNYEVQFDGSGLTSGIYLYRLQAWPAKSGVYTDAVRSGELVETKKMLMIK